VASAAGHRRRARDGLGTVIPPESGPPGSRRAAKPARDAVGSGRELAFGAADHRRGLAGPGHELARR